MRAFITPGRAKGKIAAPPSKSMAHRLLICAGLADGESILHGVSDCEDVRATVDCLNALGVTTQLEGDTVRVNGIDPTLAQTKTTLCCRESGSTLRFLIPVALLTNGNTAFEGYGRLMERPMGVYEEICRERGLLFQKAGDRLTVGGGLPSGVYRLPGDVSSQFVSGLLFALPLAKGDSVIELTTKVESRSYIHMTLDAMRAFGVLAEWEGEQRLRIPGGQRYVPTELSVEGDYSNAAFLDALRTLGSDVTLTGLREDSLQGDKCYREAFSALAKGKATISLADCPDLGPILFAVAAAKNGGIFTETERLRIKESDRVAAMQEELTKLGVRMSVNGGTVEVEGGLHAPTDAICGHNDHRIVMSMAVLLTLVGGVIEGAEAVRKSYPAFFEDLGSLGIEVRTEN